MTDPVSNRPSAGEEAAAMARRADATRDKKTDTSMATTQGAQGKKVAGGEKNLKSSFDDMLSKLSDSSTPSSSQEAAKFDAKLQEIHRDQEHSGSSDRDKDDDKKPKEKSDAGKKSKEGSEGVLRERVVGKHQGGQGQDSGKGGGEEKGGQGGRNPQQKSLAGKEQAQAEDLRKMQFTPAPSPPSPLQATTQVIAPESVSAPRELPKALLDQIVSYVRIGRDKDLNKVMEIEFQDQYFNGLQLRVTSHGKEVSVEFIVTNRSVKETFLQERENLAMTLGEKGIDCRDITVTMR